MKLLSARSAKKRKESQRILCVFLSAFLCALCGSTFLFAQSKEFSLNSDSTIHWQFRKAGDTKWHDATVPGCVHTDLLANKLIPDPFYRDNESKVQWVENEDWEYQTFFDCPKEIFEGKHCEIHFDGLDTYADVYLNDSLILRADNMFRSWNVDVKKFLREKNNRLFIHFYSAVKKGKELAAQLGYKLPGDEGGKALERKAQYQFGWDWGPRLVTCGVCKDVKLVGWNDFKFEPPVATTNYADDDSAFIDLSVEYDGKLFRNNQNAHFWLSDENNTSRVSSEIISLTDTNRRFIGSRVRVDHPNFWRSNQSKGAFYWAHLALGSDSNILSFKVSIHTIYLNEDTDTNGHKFTFIENDQPLFIKGANIIPPDNFLSRVTTADYKRLVDDAVAAHMNMLRVWGGGSYLPDEFYDYCDEKGILVWQDFMFANAMVPGDSAFAENVKQEAIDQVIRLRNHPCIALWCGNNEINEAWNNWGFQDQNKSEVNEKIWNDYQAIFDSILPLVVIESDFRRSYIESSPKFGWGHRESLQQGDSHYWGVWWGDEPFSSYENHVGRFMSEYGFQSLPSMDCMYEFATPDDWKRIPLDKKSASDVLNAHEKHDRGYELIHLYMQRDYNVPKDFEKYAYVSQLVQRDGMATAIEAHRRAKPYCMGTMYWQLNDCWPVTSWSSIDYTGQWKALHYALADDLYKTFLISMKEENDSVSVYVVSDSSKDVEAKLKIELLSLDGKERITILDSAAHLPANRSELILKISERKFPSEQKLNSYFIHAALTQDEEPLAEKNFFFAKPKDLSLTNPNITREIHYSRMKSPYEDYPSVYTITLHADAFAKDVFLSYDFEEVKFSDNFFDLLPGEDRTVIMYAKEAIDQLHHPVKIISLFDTFEK